MTLQSDICLFKKRNDEPLLMICTANKEEDFILGNLTNELFLDEIHYKYNIVIKPLQNNEVVHISGLGTQIKMTYPKRINMTVDEFYYIYYIMDSPELAKNIKFNPQFRPSI